MTHIGEAMVRGFTAMLSNPLFFLSYKGAFFVKCSFMHY
jgi:hypothetical protein